MPALGANALMKGLGLGGMNDALRRRYDEDNAMAFGRTPGAAYSPLFRRQPMMGSPMGSPMTSPMGRGYGRPMNLHSPVIPPIAGPMMNPQMQMMDMMYQEPEEVYPPYPPYQRQYAYPRRRYRRKHHPSWHDRFDPHEYESEGESDGYWSDDTCSGVYDRGYDDEWSDRNSYERRLPSWLRRGRRNRCQRCERRDGCRHRF